MTRRGGFTIVQMILFLPMLAAMMAVGFHLSTRVLRLQARENHQIMADGQLRELIQRIQREVGSADSAMVEELDDGVQLAIRCVDGGRVLYKADGESVSRVEQSGSGGEKESVWTMKPVRMDFQIERIGSRPGIVWITYERRLPKDSGPDRIRQISAAASIGRGGMM